MLILASAVGCGSTKSNESYFENATVKIYNDNSVVKATAVIKENPTTILYISLSEAADAEIDYSLLRKKGDLKLYYESSDNEKVLIVDTSKEKSSTIDSSIRISLKQGMGKFYVESDNAKFDFSIQVSVPEGNVEYFDMTSQQENQQKEKEYDEYEKKLEDKQGK